MEMAKTCGAEISVSSLMCTLAEGGMNGNGRVGSDKLGETFWAR